MGKYNNLVFALSAISLSFMLVFSFYGNTIQYANAIDGIILLTFSNPVLENVMGTTYRQANNDWYFVSTFDDAIIQVDGDTNTFANSQSISANCDNPKYIVALQSAPYLAVQCFAIGGVSFFDANAPYTFRNVTGNNNWDGFVEWVAGDRLYQFRDTSLVINVINLNCIGVQCGTMFSTFDVLTSSGFCDLATQGVSDAIIIESRNQLVISCLDTTLNNSVVWIDLLTTTLISGVTFAHGEASGRNSYISYNSFNERILVTSRGNTGDVPDLIIINALTRTVATTVTTWNRACPASTSNQQDNTFYILCQNDMYVYDVVNLSTNAILPHTALSSSCYNGWNNVASGLVGFEFIRDIKTGYFSHTCSSQTPTADNNYVSHFIDESVISEGDEFCNQAENQGKLHCRLQEEGNTGLAGTSELVDESATNIACQIGIIACTQDASGNFIPDNPDVKTNGIGYIITAISMGIFVGLLFVASRGQISDIPTFVWFIGAIAVVGGITAVQWIDPTFLIITVITVIAFAVAKAEGVFAGSGLFKGESV